MFLYLSNKSRQGWVFFFLWMPPCPCLSVVTGTVICKINCQEKCLHVNPFLEQPAIFLPAWQPASHKQETRLPCLPFLKAWHNLWKLINWKSMAIRLRRVEALSLFELTRTRAWKNKGWPKAAETAAKQALSKRDTTAITENKCQARAGSATTHRNAVSGCTTIWGLHVTAEVSSWKSGSDQDLFRELQLTGFSIILILTVSEGHGLSPFWTTFQYKLPARKSTGVRPAEGGCPGWTQRLLHEGRSTPKSLNSQGGEL